MSSQYMPAIPGLQFWSMCPDAVASILQGKHARVHEQIEGDGWQGIKAKLLRAFDLAVELNYHRSWVSWITKLLYIQGAKSKSGKKNL